MHSYCIFEMYVPLKLQCNIDMKNAHSWYLWTGFTPDEYRFQALSKNKWLFEQCPYNLWVLVTIIDIVSFNSDMWDPLFAEHAFYVGPPGQVKPNDYFDSFAVSQKDNADEGILLCHSQEGGKEKPKQSEKKSQIATKNTLGGKEMYFHRKVGLVQPTPWKGSCLSYWELKLKERSDITSPVHLGQLNCTSPYLGRRSRQGAWDQEE